jgi:hypothetical protein
MYAVPSLILFPGASVAVTDRQQCEQFFASAWDQYEGINTVAKEISIMGEAPGSVWADVSWSSGGRLRERFCYQLIEGRNGCRLPCSRLWFEPWGRDETAGPSHGSRPGIP